MADEKKSVHHQTSARSRTPTPTKTTLPTTPATARTSASPPPPPTTVLDSSELFDVWINLIGPGLDAVDIVKLSLVNKWAHRIAHGIKSHKSFASITLKKCTLIDLEICRTVEETWPNLKICVTLEDLLVNNSNNNSSKSNNPQQQQQQQQQIIPVLKATQSMVSNVRSQKVLGQQPVCAPGGLVLRSCHALDFECVSAVRLEKLGLIATRLGGSSPQSLFHFLRQAMQTLQSLEIAGGWLGTDGFKELSIVIATMPHLVNLSLIYHELGPSEVGVFTAAFERMSNLTSLSLYGNQLGPRGAEHLAPGLANMTKMKSLDLRQNNFGVEGARVLAPALACMTQLTSLNLRKNELGSEGALHLLTALRKMRLMTALDLSCKQKI